MFKFLKKEPETNPFFEIQEKISGKELPEPLPELKGIKGGEKQKWNNDHLEIISETFNKNGLRYTKALFNLNDRTLQRVLKRARKQKNFGVPDIQLTENLQGKYTERNNRENINQVNDQLTAGDLVDALVSKLVAYELQVAAVDSLRSKYDELVVENGKLKKQLEYLKNESVRKEKKLSEDIVRLQNILARPT